jgi:hypothetical protein
VTVKAVAAASFFLLYLGGLLLMTNVLSTTTFSGWSIAGLLLVGSTLLLLRLKLERRPESP